MPDPIALELGWSTWRLAFGSVAGQKPWQVTIPARDVEALSQAILPRFLDAQARGEGVRYAILGE
jgi:hypothetical protein